MSNVLKWYTGMGNEVTKGYLEGRAVVISGITAFQPNQLTTNIEEWLKNTGFEYTRHYCFYGRWGFVFKDPIESKLFELAFAPGFKLLHVPTNWAH